MSGFILSGEIKLKHIDSPGTRLKCRLPIFFKLTIMGRSYKSMCYEPCFPICLTERFKYREEIACARDICDAVCRLEKMPFTIELRQQNCCYPKGQLLAYFDSTIADITCLNLYETTVSLHNRELLMIRSYTFQGISPKIVFSTCSRILCGDVCKEIKPCCPRRSTSMIPRSTNCGKMPRDLACYLDRKYNYAMSPCPTPCYQRCCRSLEDVSCCYPPPRRCHSNSVKNHWKSEICKISQNLCRANEHINRLIGCE